MKNRFITMTLIFSFILCLTGCGQEIANNDINQTPVEMPDIMQAAQSYLMDDEKFSRVKTSDDEYLLAFYGRIDGEPEDKNRIIYLNKYNEIVTDFTIPFEMNFNNHDFYFGEKYVMMINRQYSGVDANGNMHGIAIFDTNGNLIANYEPRDPYIFTGVDMFTRFNQTGYSWCETENESIIFNTPFAIYEYNTNSKSLEKILCLEDMISNLDYDILFEDTDYLDIFGCKYGFYYLFQSDDHGLVFSVNEKLEKDLIQYTSSEKYTMYSIKNGKLNPLTEKDEYQGILRYNTNGTCMIYTDSDDKSYVINSEKHLEYDYLVRLYKLNDYAFKNNFEPLVVGCKNSASQISLNYFDSVNNKHYKNQISVSDATMGGAVYDYPFIAYGEYVYFATDDVTYDDKCYRFNVKTGEGNFVYGNVEHTPLCSGYRILEEESTTPGMIKIQIFKDYIL